MRPSETNDRIEEFNNNHFIFYNAAAPKKEQLFLFLPGTGGVPAVYQEILKVAADLGYHAAGLMYPNEPAINIVCALTLDTTCHSRARNEIFTGLDSHRLYSIDSVNSIYNRLFRLLKYLSANFPEEGWDTFVSGDSVHWQKLIMAGHSQGAGHAGYIGTIRRVARVVMFAGMDWIPLLMRPADWHKTSGKTPPENYYGFAHESDERVSFDRLQQAWKSSGMMDFGDWVSVDMPQFPYNNSHLLSTNQTPDTDPEKYHNAPVVDLYTPRNNQGELLFGPVWEYLIDFEEATTYSPAAYPTEGRMFHIIPNPVSDVCHIKCYDSTSLYDVWLCNKFGIRELLQPGLMSEYSFYTNHLAPGVYFLQFLTKNYSETIKMSVVK